MALLKVVIIVLGIIVILLIILICVVIVLTISKRKKYDDRRGSENRFGVDRPLINEDDFVCIDESHYRVVAMSSDEVNDIVPTQNSKNVLSYLYSKDYVRPTMGDALTEAKLTCEQTEMICNGCENVTKVIVREGRLFKGFTEENAASIAMYTYDFGSYNEFESNPYRIINKSLVGKNYSKLQRVSGLLYLVMSAVRKLPRVSGKTLYRGVIGKVNVKEGHYHKGNTVAWHGLSSASPDMEKTKELLVKRSRIKKVAGTLFVIENGWGYDIQPYSMFPNDEEILIEPERLFRVNYVLQADLTIINLVMLDTPLQLPGVFLDGNH